MVIDVYAPDSSYPDDQCHDSPDLFQLMTNAVQNCEEQQVQGDFNAKVGDDQHSSWSEVVGKFVLGRANDDNCCSCAL